MKKILFFWSIFLWSNALFAEQYCMQCSIVSNWQKGNKGSKMPMRPLWVDFTDMELTVPSNVIGYTLSLRYEGVIVYVCKLSSSKLYLPINQVGEYELQIRDSSYCFVCHITV